MTVRLLSAAGRQALAADLRTRPTRHRIGKVVRVAVGHPKIAVATDSDRVGSYGSDFLRNHPDIGLLAAIVGEAVITKTVVEAAQQHDIVLQHDIRAAPTTATPTTATPATAPETSTTTEAPAARDRRSPVSAAAREPRPAAREPRPAAMTHARSRAEISGSGSCSVACSHTPGTRCPMHGLAIASLRLAARALSAIGYTLAPFSRRSPALAGGNTGADTRAGGDAGAHAIGATKLLLQVCIVVPRASPMRRIVPPVLDMGAAIDVDASASPVDTATAPVATAAPVSAGRPAPERVISFHATDATSGDYPPPTALLYPRSTLGGWI